MKTIWKYELPLERKSIMLVPEDSSILKIGIQKRHLFIWMLVNPTTEKKEQRIFYMYETGEKVEIPNNKIFIDTILINDGFSVYHIFEECIE